MENPPNEKQVVEGAVILDLGALGVPLDTPVIRETPRMVPLDAVIVVVCKYSLLEQRGYCVVPEIVAALNDLGARTPPTEGAEIVERERCYQCNPSDQHAKELCTECETEFLATLQSTQEAELTRLRQRVAELEGQVGHP